MSGHSDFFKGKRPWSVIKDQVLGDYMTPYLAKVNRLGQQILLIDGYAGPGRFEDGKAGSPLIICQAAERSARGNYQAIFVNKELAHHQKLCVVLERAGWTHTSSPIRGDTRRVLQVLPERLANETVFLYLDPFGPTGCEFSLLEPFLTRDRSNASTEILLTLSVPGLHRLSGRQKVLAGRWDERLTAGFHDRLTRIFGGDYWKDILWCEEGTAEEREYKLIEAYCDVLRSYLPFVGYCPVRDADARIKYFMIFASRHPHAMVLMNDSMAKAYHSHIHRQRSQGTLFADLQWQDMRSANGFRDDLQQVILDAARQWPNETRERLWERIISGEHFMHYTRSEYLDAVKTMAKCGALICPPDPQTKRINDRCRILAPSR